MSDPIQHATITVRNSVTGVTHTIMIDKDKEDELRKYAWRVNPAGYAVTTVHGRIVRMHKMLLKGRIIDHVDRNKINNTMQNLRVVTAKLNSQNSSRRKNCRSKFFGVTPNARKKTFSVKVRNRYVGSFANELCAAYAYDQYVKQHFAPDDVLTTKLNNVQRPGDYVEYQVNRRELPKGVKHDKERNVFLVQYKYKGELSQVLTAPSRETAVTAITELQKQMHANWIMSLPVTRNKNGLAVIRTSKWKHDIPEAEVSKFEIIVDEEDWHALTMMGRWSLSHGYAQIKHNGQTIKMHRHVMQCTVEHQDYYVDHINCDRIDNRKCNLRLLHKNDSLSAQNAKKQPGCSSQYKGVSWNKNSKKWLSQIYHKEKGFARKYFTNEKEAAQWYDSKATEYYGVSARLNNVTVIAETRQWPEDEIVAMDCNRITSPTEIVGTHRNLSIEVSSALAQTNTFAGPVSHISESTQINAKSVHPNELPSISGKKEKQKSSVYRGVTYRQRDRKWRAQIHHKEKGSAEKLFCSEIEAARWYDTKAKEFFGHHAQLNFSARPNKIAGSIAIETIHEVNVDSIGVTENIGFSDATGIPANLGNIMNPEASPGSGTSETRTSLTEKGVRSKGKSSKYRGVTFQQRNQKWRGQIHHNGKSYEKTFSSEIDAARWYDTKAIECFGDRARLNLQAHQPRDLSVLIKRTRDELNPNIDNNDESVSKRQRTNK